MPWVPGPRGLPPRMPWVPEFGGHISHGMVLASCLLVGGKGSSPMTWLPPEVCQVLEFFED
eukprot:8110171-Karenia_brevis.AAC.1